MSDQIGTTTANSANLSWENALKLGMALLTSYAVLVGPVHGRLETIGDDLLDSPPKRSE